MRLGRSPHLLHRAAVPSLAVGLAVGLALAGGPVTGASGDPTHADRDADRMVRHSSDGRPGPLAAPATGARLAATTTITDEVGWTVAPGLEYRRWNQTDARGRVRAHLLTADLATEGLVLDYASGTLVRDRSALTALLARDGAVAGVNGDFFDIADTGAPLGVGRDRQIGMRNAPAAGWNSAFWIGSDGRTHIGQLPMAASVLERPALRVTNVNSPHVRPDGIGVYTLGWGTTTGYRVTDAQHRRVRQVVVRGGVVRSSSRVLTRGEPIRGQLLIGRGRGAEDLARLRVGSRATVTWGLAGAPPVAISGSAVLLSGGKVRVTDDREMHPRTAIGIDRDTGAVLLLVVDGRQDFSRGLTLVELARLMRRLGAEAALNLDGGGSSTMVSADEAGVVGVRNSPSDGRQRAVPNGLGLTYTAPAG